MASHVRIQGSQRSKRIKRSRKSKKSRKSVSPARRRCNLLLSRKVQKNMDEYLSGKKFYSPNQPIAVAYSQIRKSHPKCYRFYRKSRK